VNEERKQPGQPLPFNLYLYSVTAIGLAVLGWCAWQWAERMQSSDALLVFVLVASIYAIGALAEVSLDRASFNVAYPVIIATLVQLGPIYAMWAIWPAQFLRLFRRQTTELKKVMFNVGQLGLSAWVAGHAFLLTGGTFGSFSLSADFLPLVIATVVYDSVNISFVAMAVALARKRNPIETMLSIYWNQRKVALPFQHALALACAVMFHDQGFPGLILLTLAFVGLRYLFELPGEVERQRAQALTDGMTGLFNYRFYSEWAMGEGQRLVEENVPFTLVFVDVDHLKEVNDTLGHPAGDEVIRCVARTLSESCRRDDYIVRYAGDEFLVVLPKAGCEEGRQVAQRFVERLERTTAGDARFSVSVGIASFPDSASSVEGVLHRADQATYHAKKRPANTISAACENDECLSTEATMELRG